LGAVFSTCHDNHERLDNCLQIFEGRATYGRWKKDYTFSVWSQGIELEPVGGNYRETDLYSL
jgi:hypothetical protein